MASATTRKPLGRKSYCSIPHLPGSRLGGSDHHCDAGQARIATVNVRDRHDEVFVQEKLDGSNVAIALIDGTIHPLTRAGYRAETSPYEQHRHFARWVLSQYGRWLAILKPGERLCCEWLMQAHGTRYRLPHEPLVVFDLMIGENRTPYDELCRRLAGTGLVMPRLIHRGGSFAVADALPAIESSGHGAFDPVEGCIWRVERNELEGRVRTRIVDYLCKYVRPEKRDGIYLPEISGGEQVWNWRPAGPAAVS